MNHKFIFSNKGVHVFISLILLVSYKHTIVAQYAELQLDKRVIHPRFREFPKPAGGKLATTNPPIMLCPLMGNGKVKYSFRLSQDNQFKDASTIEAKNLPYAIFNVHSKLANGLWYWQYKAGNGNWSEIQSFKISENVPVFETPKAENLFRKIPKEHPRVLINQSKLADFRNRVAGKPDAQAIIAHADKMIKTNPPGESTGAANPDEKLTQVEKQKLALDASKNLGSLAGNGAELFCKAYILTGEKKYARAAKRWALEIASWDPDGVSKTNNFGDSKCMVGMAYTYDTCFDLLSSDEKVLLIKSITVRGNRFYNQWTNMLESKIFSGHVWQHILERLFKTSIAMLHEIPEAADWLTYIYEIWLARSPCLGPDDGGWWNGAHYFELGTLTLLDIPMYLEHYTGVEFLRSPFYKNNPTWLIYSFPTNSWSEGFGNGTEKQFEQKLGVLGYGDALSRLTGNPYAAWYADSHLNAMGKTLTDDEEFRWFRLKWQLPERPKPVAKLNLPLAKAFRETGTVNMHTDLEKVQNNLMVSLRSSPFGSTSHAHSDQNSFNIQYKGERLYYNSGYRPSMGVPHYTDWFKASIGHNTVLIDGKGQPIGSSESYGWIPRFLHGEKISYCLGDASNAYDNTRQVPQKAGLKRFRRHLIFLRPSTIVIYDELVADHDASWSWLIHSLEKSILNAADQQIQTFTKNAKSQVNFWSSQKLNMSLSTKFKTEPVNYRNIRDEEGDIIDFKDQWHITAKSEGKAVRYLVIFQIKDLSDPSDFEKLVPNTKGLVTVNGWSIHAELDPEKPATFEILNPEMNAGIMYSKTQMQIGANKYIPEFPGSTLLAEKKDGKMIVQEAIDEVPVGRD